MTAVVLPFRPPFYAVVPGEGGCPGEGDPEPVAYVRTYDGLMSAIEHAKWLSRGGGRQEVTLTEGRRTRLLGWFENGAGQLVHADLLPAAYPENWRPDPGDIRPGSPHGHIPEICTHARNRKAGRTPRRSPNMPRASWPGIL